MKRLLFIIPILVACTNPSNSVGLDLPHWSAVELLREYHKQELTEFDKLTLAIALTESKFKADAVGTSGDWGVLQITEPFVNEVNRVTGSDFKHEDAFDIDSSLAIFFAMQAAKNPERSIDRAIALHNKSANYKRVVLENLELINRYETFRKSLVTYE